MTLKLRSRSSDWASKAGSALHAPRSKCTRDSRLRRLTYGKSLNRPESSNNNRLVHAEHRERGMVSLRRACQEMVCVLMVLHKYVSSGCSHAIHPHLALGLWISRYCRANDTSWTRYRGFHTGSSAGSAECWTVSGQQDRHQGQVLADFRGGVNFGQVFHGLESERHAL